MGNTVGLDYIDLNASFTTPTENTDKTVYVQNDFDSAITKLSPSIEARILSSMTDKQRETAMQCGGIVFHTKLCEETVRIDLTNNRCTKPMKINVENLESLYK